MLIAAYIIIALGAFFYPISGGAERRWWWWSGLGENGVSKDDHHEQQGISTDASYPFSLLLTNNNLLLFSNGLRISFIGFLIERLRDKLAFDTGAFLAPGMRTCFRLPHK